MTDRRRSSLVLVGICLLLAVVLWLLYQRPIASEVLTPPEHAVAVDVITLARAAEGQRTEVRLPISASGVVRPARQVALVARVSGTVLEAHDSFRDGGVVAEDAVLLNLDPEPYQLALARQRHDTSAARLHLAETSARAQVARRTNSDQASDYARLVPHMEEARGRLAAAEAGLRNAQRELDETRISAPFAGRLKEVLVQPGQYVNAGERVATLYTTDRMEVRLPVRDDALALIDMPLAGDIGDASPEVVLSGRFGGQERQWPGRIVRREGGLSENRMIYLVAQVDDALAGSVPLEPGMLVDATIHGRGRPELLRLPASVMSGNQYVWRVDEDERLRRIAVTPVYQNADNIWLAPAPEGELSEGDRVALSGSQRWLEGTRVEARPFGNRLHAERVRRGESSQ
ncbi:MAG: efflux RND transporter periplasmic adaptor subunit [Alcanivorax sp.]|nr:efflux RND transporter periplasmic adaptor subunit [Alcanivorax sp.]